MYKRLLVLMVIAAGLGATAAAQTPQPESIATAKQREAADLFNGLRYDLMKSAKATWAQMSPDVRRKLDALALIMDDVTAAPLDRRGGYLDEFLTVSAPLVRELSGQPCQFSLWTLRIAAFLEVGRTHAALETSRQLYESGIPADQGPTVRNFMATLERKGWFISNVRPALIAAKAAPSPQASPSTSAPDDPIAVYRVTPVYPVAAQELNLAGRVRVKFAIAPDGSVKDVRMAGNSCTIFDDAALTAVSQWRYKPPRRNGVASERPDVSVALSFKLTG